MSDYPDSRSLAKRLGHKKYYTGVPCKNGHIDYRYATNGKCKTCEKEWREENAEKVSSYVRKSNRKLKESMKEWRKNNPEKLKEYRQTWQKRNPEKAKECAYNWRKNNRVKVNSYQRQRRARILDADGYHSETDINNLIRAQSYKCAYCYKKINKNTYHVDHVYPISKGGSNWPSNLQILCPSCNFKKNAKDPIDWAQENGRLL